MPWKEKDICDNRQLPQVPTGWRKATLGLPPQLSVPILICPYPGTHRHFLSLLAGSRVVGLYLAGLKALQWTNLETEERAQ